MELVKGISDKNGFSFLVYDCVDSTNAVAKQLARQGAPQFTTVLAQRQTAGRGRLGRSFFSPQGGIYLSIVLRPDVSLENTLYITASAAVAVCRAIERVADVQCLIKWVNDIYIDGKKVCGILTEGALNPDTARLEYAVLGIGINLTVPSGGYPQDIANRAAAIFGNESVSADKKECLINAIAEEFAAVYQKIEQKEFLREYKQRSYLDGKEIYYSNGGKTYKATVLGVDDDACLTVLQDGKRITLNSGDVSLHEAEVLK